MKRFSALVCLGFLLALEATPATSDEFHVDYPFASDTAKENFKRCFPETTPEQASQLGKIRRFGYAFGENTAGCPATKPNCRPGTEFFEIARETYLDAGDLDPSAVQARIRANLHGGCSYDWYDDFSMSLGLKKVTYGFKVGHTERMCDDVLGKWNISEGSARVAISALFNPDSSITSNVQFGSVSGKILGFVDMSVLGALAAPPITALTSAANLPAVLAEKLLRPQMPGDMGGMGIDVHWGSVGILDSIYKTTVDYVLDYESSGFVSMPVLAIYSRQHDFVDAALKAGLKADRAREIQFIKDLSEVSPSSTEVRRGDSYWKLVKDRFGDARIYVLSSQLYPPQRALARLRPGDRIMLPRWQDVCEELKSDPLNVKTGQSLWSKMEAGDIPRDSFSHVATFSGNRDLVYPFERLTVRTMH